jgi:Fur family ferric uptake transcriptional regulator
MMAKPIAGNLVERAESIFRDYLRGRGLKYTPERKAVLREVLTNNEHFEAEQLLITLLQGGERIAKATIYRTLPLLVDCGIIQQVQFGDNVARYEHTFGQQPHDHMVCRQCRRIIEFDSSEVTRLRAKIADRHGFAAQSHRFQISGVCAACRDERSDKTASPAPASEAASTGPRRSGSSGR